MEYSQLLKQLELISYPEGIQRTKTICATNCKVFCIKSDKLALFAKHLAPYREQIIYDFPDNDYYEVDILKAYLVTRVKCSLADRIRYIERLSPYIENWSVCDSLGKRFILKPEQEEQFWALINSLLASSRCFERRLGLDLILSQLIKKEYLDRIFTILDSLNYGDYYMDMSAAWLLSEMYGKYNQQTVNYFVGKNNLSKFVHNKALQKARESFRVTEQQKQVAKELKRV